MPYPVPTRAEIEALLYASKKCKIPSDERKLQVVDFLKEAEVPDEDIAGIIRDIESYLNWPVPEEVEVEVFE